MFDFFTNLFGKKSRPAAPRGTFRPQMESLEERRQMAANVFVNSGGDLEIKGDQFAANTVIVTQEVYSGVGYYRVNDQAFGRNFWFQTSSVWGGDVIFYGGPQGDYFHNKDTPLRTTAYGDAGNDYLFGSYMNDNISGGTGFNYLYGFGGDDYLNSAYNDYSGSYFNGGDGNDQLYGGNGRDIMWGGAGNDYMYGNGGDDELYGESGSDYMYGGNGKDYLDGGLDYDIMYGQNDSDSLNGGDDGVADYMNGGAGYDYFQIDWVYNYYYGYWYNRDQPVDAGEGSYNF
jgi:hypothetical protein